MSIQPSRRRSLLLASALSTLLALGATACSPRVMGASDSARSLGQVITSEEIARSPARNAWELLEGRVPQLRFADGVAGNPVGVRGRDASGRPPVVVLNGTITHGIEHLHAIPARDLRIVRVLSGSDAGIRYGAYGANGAIVIETHRR